MISKNHWFFLRCRCWWIFRLIRVWVFHFSCVKRLHSKKHGYTSRNFMIFLSLSLYIYNIIYTVYINHSFCDSTNPGLHLQWFSMMRLFNKVLCNLNDSRKLAVLPWWKCWKPSCGPLRGRPGWRFGWRLIQAPLRILKKASKNKRIGTPVCIPKSYNSNNPTLQGCKHDSIPSDRSWG